MSRTERIPEAELEILQQKSFSYFLHETNTDNGLVIDKTAADGLQYAATGLAGAYTVAVERGLCAARRERTRPRAFFWNSPQGRTRRHRTGLLYHFLTWDRPARLACELSTIDSFLLAGALTAGVFDADTADEREIRASPTALSRADWQWAQNHGEMVTHGWKPESGFLKYRWEGYDEAMLLYILGLGSPAHSLPESCYAAWASTYRWERCYGIEYLYAGPLFTHQLSHVWIDFRGIQDAFMRVKGIDYFENSRRATYVQQQYAVDNPLKFAGYGPCCWGITASDGPGSDTIKVNGIERQFFDYLGRGVPYGPDDGTLAPWSVVTSLPFAPEIVLPAIDYFIHQVKLTAHNPYGFKATFNPTYPVKSGNPYGWVSPWHYGLNQGPIVLMIENYRTGLLWRLMRDCPSIAMNRVWMCSRRLPFRRRMTSRFGELASRTARGHAR